MATCTYTQVEPHLHFDTMLLKGFDAQHFTTSHYDDFETTFSDDISLPAYSSSSKSLYSVEEAELDPNNPLTPLKSALVQCCRCPNSQTLTTDYPDERTEGYHAVCDACTHAFCRKCTVDTDNVIAFDAKSKAHILQDSTRINYFWCCSTCGLLQGISRDRVRRVNDVTSIDIKKLQCQPCNQKANSTTLCVAAINQTTVDFLSMSPPTPSINTWQRVEKEVSNRSTSPSNSWISKPSRNKTFSSLDMKKHWSLQTIKRWASSSSTKTA